jgi:hypothetical protein
MVITAPTINNGDPIDATVVQDFVDQVEALRKGNIDHDNLQLAKPWTVMPLKGWYLTLDDSGIGYVDMAEGPAYTMIPFRLPPQNGKTFDPKMYYKIANVLVTADAWSTSENMAVELHRYTDETYTAFGPALLTAVLASDATPGHKLVVNWADTVGDGSGDLFIDCEATWKFYAWHLFKVNRVSNWRTVSIQGEVWYYPFEG